MRMGLSAMLLLGSCPDEAGPAGGGLEIARADGETETLSDGDLRAMPSVEGYGGMLTSIGEVRGDGRYRGVPLEDLVGRSGGLREGEGLRVVASDGYAVTLSREQALSGGFAGYDRSTGEERADGVELRAALAYEVDGAPLDEEAGGPYRLVIVGDDPEIVSDAFFWVRSVVRLEVEDLGGDWSLRLEGAVTEEVSRASFQTCSSCHSGSFVDERGREWSGVPLWLLVGKVDDENTHDVQAFNRELASTPYTIVVHGSGDDEVRLSSDRIAEDDSVVLAHRVASVPLEEGDFPLRLVGPSLSDEETIGGVESIALDVP
jgi:DMSO/TMAO reductase YedYZ molybdopterin-dependent catalytic subunit